jgi:hypothetical protein
LPVQPSPSGKPSLQIVFGLALAACVVVAALVWQLSYDDGAPQLASSPSSLPPEDRPLPAQPAPSIVQMAAAEPAPLQTSAPQAPSPQASPPPAPVLAQAAPAQEASPPTAAPPPDQAQLLQTISRNLADLERNIEQLKANQQQMASDNAKAITELKASQEEMRRALAKASEQTPPRASAAAPQPAPSVRRPERSRPQARSRPRYPREWLYEDDW